MRSTRTALLAITTLIGSLLSGVGQAQEEMDNSIRAQPLTKALAEFAEQTGMQLVYPSELTAGIDSNGASTEGAPDEILDQLLASTGLDYEYVNDRTIAIAASVMIDVDDQGGASDSKNLNSAPILMAQNTNQTSTTSSRSDGAADSQEEESSIQFEEIVVTGTGTNIRGAENPTVPVLTFNKEDIDLSGASTVDEFLRTIPQNFGSETQLSAESANPNDSATNRTQGTTVDLRGLGAGSTLTLLNGRRMTVSGAGAVDINVLPLGIIERVDVLIDGASAVYGSDAVGGAINFVTRKDYEGFDIKARYGTVTNGSKEDWGIGVAGGYNWGTGSAFASVDYQEVTPLLVEERDFIDLTQAREGATLGSDRERLSAGGGLTQDFGRKARFGMDVLYTDSTSESFSLIEFEPRTNTSEQKALYVNSRFEYEITTAVTASLFLDYGQNRVDNEGLLPDGTILPTSFDNDLLVYEGQVSGRLFEILGGDVSFSLGALHRTEEFVRTPISGIADIEADRSVFATYVEALIPFVGDDNAIPLIQRLDLSLAGRYEDYDDVGDSFDPKIGLFWQASNDLAFRASYSESFRAPDLVTLNADQLFVIFGFPTAFFTAISPPPASTSLPFPGQAAVLIPSGGNPSLRPESAETWSAGLVYEPSFFPGLTIQGNFYDIQYRDRIEGVPFVDTLQDPNFADFIDVPPNIADVQSIFDRADAGEITLSNFFGLTPGEVQVLARSGMQNIARRDTRGVDLTLVYSRDTDIGKISTGFNGNYVIDYIAQPSELASSSEQVDILYRPVEFRARGSVSWSSDGLTVYAALNYTNSYRDRIDESIANSISSWTTVDLTATYDFGDNAVNSLLSGARIGVSATNIFDQAPPFVTTPEGLNFDTTNANPFGRQVNITISRRF